MAEGMEWVAKWICPKENLGEVCPSFEKAFQLDGNVRNAKLFLTALGVYEARLNESRIGEFFMAPGWTAYRKRLQYQEYDVTELLQKDNYLTVTVGSGWYHGKLPGWGDSPVQEELKKLPTGILAQLEVTYEDGRKEVISSDESWTAAESNIRSSEIYNGETYDAAFAGSDSMPVRVFHGPFHTLIAQQGEEVHEQERISPVRLFQTPKGEMVVDFGQNLTGYVEITVEADEGEEIVISHAEVLDKEGNFYTENYRGAKAVYRYICKQGRQTCHALLTYYGFRYIRLDRFPGKTEASPIPEQFCAVVVHSELERTGQLCSSNPLLNRLFENITWGQKGNFLDVPTDCPQRDERLGWTGDAQVFIRTACYQFDTERFFTKWLADMAADQGEDGRIGHVVPDILQAPESSAAWGDAAAICPWELYLAYGNKEILRNQWECMKKWVGYITGHTKEPYLWIGGNHYGDWLGLDAPSGSYKGSTREDFIASAFYAHSVSLLIKAGNVLKLDVSEYEELYQKILITFRRTFPTYQTQTECVLAVHFGLAEDRQAAADQLAAMVQEAGVQLKTGFVGTPYLLHVLSDYGYTQLAYSLLLRKEYPSWLYPVTKGATTVWEHWDGIMENGEFWSKDMNSFNHYAYGAVADWVYSAAAGICPIEEAPGYQKVRIAPHPDSRLDWLEASLKTRYGKVFSKWRKQDGNWRYEIETPVEANIIIAGKEYHVKRGNYVFFSETKE